MPHRADDPGAGVDPAPLVSVIIPARNASATLNRALCAVVGQEGDVDFEVIVVDDGSSDATAEVAGRHEPSVRQVRNESPRGPGSARNRGVLEARGRVLAFTDADCFPDPLWLARGVEALQGADLVQGAVTPDPEAPRTPFERTLTVDRASGFFQTANLLVRRELFETVGGFRDWSLDRPEGRLGGARARRRFQKHTPPGEDALFGWSARRLGAVARFAPEVRVYHAVFPSTVPEVMADRWHWTQEMPGLARLVPELRSTAFHRQVFFSRWTMQFDAAILGVVITAATKRKTWLALAIPYAVWRARQARRWGLRRAPRVALAGVAVDAVTLAGLIAGSITWRCLVL